MEVIVFLIGFVAARLYYTFSTKDWGSWGWSENKWWLRYHRVACFLCPRKHYCERRKHEYSIRGWKTKGS